MNIFIIVIVAILCAANVSNRQVVKEKVVTTKTVKAILKVYGANNDFVLVNFNDKGKVCFYKANGELIEETGAKEISGFDVLAKKFFDSENNLKSEYKVSIASIESKKSLTYEEAMTKQCEERKIEEQRRKEMQNHMRWEENMYKTMKK